LSRKPSLKKLQIKQYKYQNIVYIAHPVLYDSLLVEFLFFYNQ